MSDVELAAVESFALDHTKVLAPYVRLIGVEHGPKGDAISNFDIRLVQPNAGEIPTAGLHTIEHTIAALLRTRFNGLIDISPFGCRTGFHMIALGRADGRRGRRGDQVVPHRHRRARRVVRRAGHDRRELRQLPRPQPALREGVVEAGARAGHQHRRLRSQRDRLVTRPRRQASRTASRTASSPASSPASTPALRAPRRAAHAPRAPAPGSRRRRACGAHRPRRRAARR